MIDGQKIENPLRSFVFPQAITDEVTGTPIIYSKPEGYETVRYPLSGLVGTESDRVATAAHNAQFKDPAKNITCRQRTTNCRQTLRMALPLSLRKSAMVLKSGAKRPVIAAGYRVMLLIFCAAALRPSQGGKLLSPAG